MSETKHPPACIDCRWCSKQFMLVRFCTAPMGEPSFDPVLGGTRQEHYRDDAYVARSLSGACGPDGKLFERKP